MFLLTVSCMPHRPSKYGARHTMTYAIDGNCTEVERAAILKALRAWTEATHDVQQFEADAWEWADIRFWTIRSHDKFVSIGHYQKEDWWLLAGLWVANDRTALLLGAQRAERFEAVVAHEIGHALHLYESSPSLHNRDLGVESIMHADMSQFPNDMLGRGIPVADVVEYCKVRGC